jgi:hypothetical protein
VCSNATVLHEAFTIDSEYTGMPLNTTKIPSFWTVKNLLEQYVTHIPTPPVKGFYGVDFDNL